MNLSLNYSKYLIPILGTACVGGGLLVISALQTPANTGLADDMEASELRTPQDLSLSGYVPTMEEVVEKHLFVPEREATGEKSFPDLLVKGVYVGETERNAVFSLKSKPGANLRVWQGDEESALAQVVDERDPRQPIVGFLSEWHIKAIDFSGVTVEHVWTGETEIYEVDYKPLKHVKASAQNGYGQGYAVDASQGGVKTAAAKPAVSGSPAQARTPSAGSATAVAGKVGQYIQKLSPQQRQQFMQQLQKQNAAAAKKQGGSSKGSSSGGKGSKSSQKSNSGRK